MKRVGYRVCYWRGEPIEDSTPDYEYFDTGHTALMFARAVLFARKMKKQNRLGYLSKIELKKDENGDDERNEVKQIEV